MNELQIRPAHECRYDMAALGEVMLRFDPAQGRIRSARSFDIWEGGGEYNVVRALSRTFGMRTSILTSLVDNEIGHLLSGLIQGGGVDTSNICWRGFDGTGRSARNALNFTERGFGIRGALGVSDRANSASSQLRADDFDLKTLFAKEGVAWLHTGGIFAGLSASSAQCARDVMDTARAHGTIVSVDLNFRPSLFIDDVDGQRVRSTFAGLAARADILVGGFQDFEDRIGVGSPAPGLSDDERLKNVAQDLFRMYPDLKIVASTIRNITSASIHGWSAHAVSRSGEYAKGRAFDDLAILDRVGGGDGFVSGLASALLDGGSLQTALDVGVAHGALVMTTPGDNSMASRQEVAGLARNPAAFESR